MSIEEFKWEDTPADEPINDVNADIFNDIPTDPNEITDDPPGDPPPNKTTEDDDPKEEPVEFKFGDFGKELVERNLFDKEPESPAEIFEKIDELALDKISEVLKDLPTESQAFLKHTLKGGTLENYSSAKIPEFDITNPTGQEEIIRYQLVAEGKDEFEVDALVSTYKDKDLLATKAKEIDGKLKDAITNRSKDADKAMQDRIIARKSEILTAIREAESKTADIKTVYGKEVKPEEVKELVSYGFRPTIKTADNEIITPLERDLRKLESLSDPEKYLRAIQFIKSGCDPKIFGAQIASAVPAKRTERVERQSVKKDSLDELVKMLDKGK